MTFGQSMIAAREKRGLTRPMLARKAGIPKESLGNYERDQSYPGLFNLLCLSDALGISIDEYVGHEVRRKERPW